MLEVSFFSKSLLLFTLSAENQKAYLTVITDLYGRNLMLFVMVHLLSLLQFSMRFMICLNWDGGPHSSQPS